jgi:putative heme iron utilization protein
MPEAEMTKEKKDVLQPVDDAARRLAKTLIRTARHAALGTIDPTDGSPFVSRVSLATAMDGAPVFLISRLSGHFTNLEADPRCSLLIGDPGKGDPLAHARITLVGTSEMLQPGRERDSIKSRYLSRHPKSSLYADFPDFAFWKFRTARASLNGGFGKAFAPKVSDLITSLEGVEGLVESEEGAVAHMNSDHADAVEKYAVQAGAKHPGWKLSALDPEGLDLTSGDDIVRLWFENALQSAQDLRPVLVALAKKG